MEENSKKTTFLTATSKPSTNARVTYASVPRESTNIDSEDKTRSLRRTFQISWWERRTKTEKKFIIWSPVAFLLTLLVIVVLAAIVVKKSIQSEEIEAGSRYHSSSGHVGTCVTRECVETAYKILELMNTSVDPCEDFSGFACGSRSEVVSMTTDESSFDRLKREQEKILKALFKSPISADDKDVVKDVKKLYRSCRILTKGRKVFHLGLDLAESSNSTLHEFFSNLSSFPPLPPLRPTRPIPPAIDEFPATMKNHILNIFREFGGWPILETNWDETSVDLTDLIARWKFFATCGKDFLIVIVESDAKNSEENVIYLSKPKSKSFGPLSTSTDFFIGERHRHTRSSSSNASSEDADDVTKMKFMIQAYYDVVRLGATINNQTKKDIDDMARFRRELEEIFDSDVIERGDHDASYRRMTINDLYTNLTQEIDWLRYLRTIFFSVNISIESNEPVVVLSPDYIVQLGMLLKSTSIRTVVNYMLWQIVLDLDKFLKISEDDDDDVDENNYDRRFSSSADDDWRQRKRKLLISGDCDTWHDCYEFVRDALPMTVSRMYIERLNRETKQTVSEMVEDIRVSMIELIDGSTWLDQKSKYLLREKASSISEKVAYPELIFNDTFLKQEHLKIEIDSEDFTKNVFNLHRNFFKRSLELLRQPIDKSRWIAHPVTVNAFYVASRNEIIIPTGLIQSPFYRQNRYPRALNFGGLGYVIGHELTHAFGALGLQYDKSGNLRRWWNWSDPETLSNIKSRSMCLIQQYDNYTIGDPPKNTKINGTVTFDENMADNGGMKQAFRGYRRWVTKEFGSRGEEERLPGLNLSGNQLFFLQFAQAMCGKGEFDERSRHSPTEVRILGTLSNSEEFSETYGCTIGSKMNPVKKCSLW